ncbi:Hypothetical protein A7982_02399 [Minicystis rosea]|nr:Hypothetical protein A7982_02399 [Minicystis rosea]
MLIVLLVVLIIPVGLFLVHDARGERAWGLVPDGEQIRGTGAYREVRERSWKRGRAPLTVQLAAFTCFLFGQMVVPGALAALGAFLGTMLAAASGRFLPVFFILTCAAPTGLVVAMHLLAAGAAMLACDADATAQARSAARWAIIHNGVLLVALGLAMTFDAGDRECAVLPVLFGIISLLQGALVWRAATVLEAYVARQKADPAPAEAEMRLLGRESARR